MSEKYALRYEEELLYEDPEDKPVDLEIKQLYRYTRNLPVHPLTLRRAYREGKCNRLLYLTERIGNADHKYLPVSLEMDKEGNYDEDSMRKINEELDIPKDHDCTWRETPQIVWTDKETVCHAEVHAVWRVPKMSMDIPHGSILSQVQQEDWHLRQGDL